MQATLSTSTLSAGSHTIDAAYSGDSNYSLSSAATWTQVVNAAASATVITETLGANPSTFGDALTFTATVSGPGGTPTGTVQFSIDGVASGLPVALLGGQATLSTSALTAGSHTIDAAYSGDPNFTLSSATTWTQVVNAAASRRSSPNDRGQPLDLRRLAHLHRHRQRPGRHPDGHRPVLDRRRASGSPVGHPLAGVATLSTSALTAGSHTIDAAYSGDPNFTLSSATT